MRTPVCELLGIEQPIVLAPMVAVPPLAAAVSNAGALGMLTLTWSDPNPRLELATRRASGAEVRFLPGMMLRT